MPIVSERAASRQNVKSSITSQFWEQPVHSSKSLDGQLWSLPCEPPALNLTGSSGLSRTQQLLAAQAVRVPFFPSYDGSNDGLVLDRVLAKTGGRRWWAALSGRVKAQRAYNLGASGAVRKVDAVRDLGNYALCSRGHFQLGRRLTLNAVAEAPDTRVLASRLRKLRELRRTSAALSSSGGTDASASPAAAGGSASASIASGSQLSGSSSAGGVHTSASGSSAVPELEPYTAHAALRCAMPGHDLTATAGYNLQYVDSAGDVSHVPLAVSLDLASHDRADGLQYRVGLHQVTAPPTELPTRPGHALQRWRTSLYAQGALAVEGEAHIWRGGASSKESKDGSKEGAAATAAASSSSQPAEQAPTGAALKQQGKGGSGGGGSEEAGASEEQRRSKLAAALDKAKAADEEPVLPLPPRKRRSKSGEAPHQLGGDDAAAEPAAAAAAAAAEPEQVVELQSPAAADGGGSSGGGAPAGSKQPAVPQASEAAEAPEDSSAVGPAPQRQPVAALESFIRPLEQMGERVSEMGERVGERVSDILHWHPPQQQQQQQGGGEDSGYASGSSSDAELQRVQQSPSSSSSSSHASGSGGLLQGLSSQTITATIQDSVALLQQVKDSVERLTSNVQDGSLQRLSQQLADSRQAPQRRRPYSMLLAQPHMKLNAAMGCLARMPMPALRAFSFPQASLEPLDPSGTGAPPQLGGTGTHGRHASTSSLVSRASVSSQLAEAWQPYFKGTALRVFASAGLSGQLGRFTRPWLDYTAVSARVDVGLTSPHVVGVVPDAATLAADAAHRPDKHRAFALEGRGAWHALSVSMAQQVFGPVRVRMDARFALDPTSVPASEGERSTLKGVLQTALSVRPSLLESVYGFDVVLPGTEGAARLAVWWSPKRRECMAELRLF